MSSSRLSIVMAALVVGLFTVAVLPVMAIQLEASASFMTALVAAVTVFDLMSAYLLLGDFRDRGDRRSLVTGLAYVFSLMVMFGYALAFPGAIFTDPPLSMTTSTAPYLYVIWHCAFPTLLGLAWAPWPTRMLRPVPPQLRRRVTMAWTAGAALAGAAVVALVCVFARDLPALINGLDTSRMTTLTAPVALPLVILALALTVRGTWELHGPERWTVIAVLACLCDLILTYLAHSRFSVGWYSGRSLTIVAAGVVLVAMLASFRRLKAQAEDDAVRDPLTGLLNRRGADVALDLMFAQSRRSGEPLAALVVDLDLFKAINDTEGHGAGDKVLARIGRTLDVFARDSDLCARPGGEEFLLALPRTDLAGALMAAERLRASIASLVVPGVRSRVTASIGVAVSGPLDDLDSLLRRADSALYAAKREGRNRVAHLEPAQIVSVPA